VLSLVAKLGFDNTSLRFVAQYRAVHNHNLLWGLVRYSSRLSGLASVAGAVLLATTALLLQSDINGDLATCLMLAGGVLAIMPLTQVYEATLIALGRVVQGLTSLIVTPLLFMVLLFAMNRWTGIALASPTAMLLYIAASLASFLIVRGLLRQSLGQYLPGNRAAPTSHGAWLAMAIPMMALHVLVYIQGQSGTILCGLFLGTEQSGLYTTAARMAGLAVFGLQSINTIAAPRIAALHGSGRTHELQDYMQMCSWGSLGFALPLAVLIGILARPLLMLFGPEFVAGQGPLLILLFGLVINAATGPVAQLLYMTGHHAACLKLYAAMATVVLALQIFCIPRYGIMGAAVITCGVQIVWNISLVFMAKARLGVWSLVSVSSLTRGFRELISSWPGN